MNISRSFYRNILYNGPDYFLGWNMPPNPLASAWLHAKLKRVARPPGKSCIRQ